MKLINFSSIACKPRHAPLPIPLLDTPSASILRFTPRRLQAQKHMAPAHKRFNDYKK